MLVPQTVLLRAVLPLAGYGLAVLFFWFWHGARENTAEEIERCNADKIAAVQDAEAAVRSAMISNYEEKISEMERLLLRESRARQIAEEARMDAESRPPVVRTVIREVAGENACIDTAVPDAVLDSLR
jgi:hypothetical protein